MEKRRIGRFEVERVLGQGGMGIVYVARDALLDRRVALKVLPPGRAEDAEDRQRLLREARSAAALSHPNVATVLEAGEDEGAVYLAMELVEGETLAERIGRGSISDRDVVRIGLGIARGLASAHASGVLHRDLKPANVILGPELTPKLVDFGLARAPRSTELEERLSYTGTVVGTPGYMAPEQVQGGKTDARTDVFALGVVLHEMWSGTTPFGGTGLAAMSAVLYDDPRPLEETRPGAPVELRELVGRCLARDPAGRPTDASVVVRVLAALAGKLAGSGPAIDPAPSGPRAMPLAPTIEVVRSSVKPRQSVSSLVGREHEIDTVERALASGCRLVTIAGPPGIGKSRLASELVRRTTERGERAVSVALGAARTIADLEAATLAVLRRVSGASSLAELLALEDGILVLDGGEAIGDALRGTLEAWLRSGPKLRVIAASRSVLRLPSEQVVLLEPLREAVGVELFASRARRARTLLVFEDAERSAAAEIVRILDGNPLAIALAAARVSLLWPAQIASRLRERAQDRLALLTDRSATSLAETIAWSFQLLDPETRGLAIELSVLGGAFDAEAAEAIATAPAGALDGMERLCDASLLRTVDADGATRLMMDPNVRAYALRELGKRPDASAIAAAHVVHFGGLAERTLTRAQLGSPTRETALVHLDLSIAMTHALGAHDGPLLAPGLWAAAMIAQYGEAQDANAVQACLVPLRNRAANDGASALLLAHAELGLSRLRRLRDPAAAASAARAAVEHARHASHLGLVHRARVTLVDALIVEGAIGEADVEASTALAEARDVDEEIDALDRVARVAWRKSELDGALVAMRRALSLVEARRDRPRQADVLVTMGIVCVQQRRFEEARAAYERARELARAEGALSLVGSIANNLGVIHHEQERLDEARAAFVEATEDARKSGRALLFAIARGDTGFVDQERDQRADARVAFDEAIATLAAVGDVRYRAAYMLGRAALLADEGDPVRARAEVAAAAALVGTTPEPQVRVLVAIRSAYVELACATDEASRAAAVATLNGYLAELDRPESVAAQSDIARMALRLARRRLTSG